MRTPYGRTTFASESLQVHALALADAGYSVVLQDVRGRGDSEGAFSPFVNEQSDGLDTIDWVADQSWCNGSIGLAGISYNAFAQTAIASGGSDAVACWVPGLAPSDIRTSWIRRGGVFDLGFHLAWGLGAIATVDARTERPEALLSAFDEPVATARRGIRGQSELASTPAGKWFFEWAESKDPYPENLGIPTHDQLASVEVPALVVAGWFDVFSSGSLELLESLRSGPRGGHHRLVGGPWDHSGLPLGRKAGERDFGLSAAIDLHELQLEWFDAHLKDGGDVRHDRIFLTGRNAWTLEPSWPPTTEDLTLYLAADRLLTEEPGSPTAIEVSVDPNDPPPVPGGAVFPWEPALRPGAHDQRQRRDRPDVAAFSGRRLESPLIVAGSARVHVPVAGTPQRAVVATLVELTPSGPHWNISDGVGSIDAASGVASLHLGPVAHEFSIGSRIGLDLAFAADVRLAPAERGRSVIDAGRQPAYLVLPVVT